MQLTRPGSDPEPVNVGCEPVAAVADAQLHVDCTDGRLRSFSLASPPVLIREQRVEGDVRSLFMLGSQAWVEIARYEARPVRQAGGSAVVPVQPFAPGGVPPSDELAPPTEAPVEPVAAAAPANEENIVFP